MTYLLDVNALVALGVADHVFYQRVSTWVESWHTDTLATCSITELGFLRVLSQAAAYGLSVVEARSLLERIKKAAGPRFIFLPDTHDSSHLPAWVKWPKQITDGHLKRLASSKGAVLATLDENIPESYLIPR